MSETLLRTAAELADDVLFPSALEADRSPTVPEAQLDALAAVGLYGLSVDHDASTVVQVLEILAGGCLTTAFVFAQHLGATRAVWESSGPVRGDFAEDLTAGRARAGVAFAHLLRPGDPLTVAEPVLGGWRFSGVAPWITGWGHIDVVHAGARRDGTVVWALIDAVECATMRVERLELSAVNASSTVVAHFDGHVVPEHRVTRVDDYEAWTANYRLGLRANGSLPLGVAGRCCRLLGPSALDDELIAVRERLDATSPSDPAAMAAARADAALFAVRAATSLVVSVGGRSVMLHEHAQRLMRESMFLLVQGQTPSIKAEMLEQLSATPNPVT